MNEISFSQVLVSWYHQNGRNLPWRLSADAYRIWVSEIILQQTRVAQGLSYFERFVQRFPDVDTLALASEAEVLKYWEGLGYYSRARNLHAAARQIHQQGGFPETYDGIRALRGVGDYTAAAIASFAFHLPYAVVDGNVYRVLSRYLGIDIPIDSAAGKKLFAQKAAEMLHPTDSATYNQAIMDFGALQCLPQNPSCLICPLSSTCKACLQGRVGELPVKKSVTKVRPRYFTYIYILVHGEVAIWKRSSQDIWAGLYQPYLVEWEENLPSENQLCTTLSESLGIRDSIGLQVLSSGLKQRLSHQMIHASFYRLELPERPEFPASDPEVFWVPLSNLDEFPFPKMLFEVNDTLF